MTDPETQPDPAAEPDTDVHSKASVGAPGEPASRPPSPPPSWWRRPTRVQILALVGAFLLGACLCGGLAVVIGAAVFHDGFDRGGDRGSDHGSYERGNDGPGNRNGNQKGRGDGELQKPQQIAPPAPPATVAPSPSASLTPAASPS